MNLSFLEFLLESNQKEINLVKVLINKFKKLQISNSLNKGQNVENSFDKIDFNSPMMVLRERGWKENVYRKY